MSDWEYYPGLCVSIGYQQIFNHLSEHFSTATDLGKSGSAEKRYSFVVGKGYSHLHSVEFKDVPIINHIKEYIQQALGIDTKYCLVHLYLDGSSGIAWHNDKEALNTSVVSVSFGATREFRFRNLGQKTGYCKSFMLNSGDLLIMKAGCQTRYEHSIIKSTKVTEPRINLTFRQ